MIRSTQFPFFVVLMGLSALAMLPPAIVALQLSHFATARAFFYSGLLLLVLTSLIALAMAGFRPSNLHRAHLLTLAGAYLGLPFLFALPFQQAVQDTTWMNAVFEMVSCFTTTGATAFDAARLDPALHLWRAEVGWLGGLFVWITAAAIFAPLNLGGFEVTAKSEPGRGVGGSTAGASYYETAQRLRRVSMALAPVYAGLTLVLWICLILAGDAPLTAVVFAMSTLSTSGIAPGDAVIGGVGISGELLVLLFMLFALSQRTFSNEAAIRTSVKLIHDPEMRMGGLLIVLATAALFLRHFYGAVDMGAEVDAVGAFSALWGTFFTVLSFLTTTGFASIYWAEAQQWSGLGAGGFALIGLAIMGGGVATTAGGVKLLRVYALWVHSRRELNRLVHPSLVFSQGKPGREIAMRGVYIAWVFFMLFALSIAAVWLALSALGLEFEPALLLTVSALSTTGPLAPVVTDGAVNYLGLAPAAKAVLMFAMILGRLETLAIVALFNAEFWRG